MRPEFFEAADSQQAVSGDEQRPTSNLLVFGGSQGAHAINVAMVEAAPQLAAARPVIVHLHQTGERDRGDGPRRLPAGRASAPTSSRSSTTWDGDSDAADLIVCRAGATTLAEITAAGKAAILIPLPTATDDHQRKNAETLASAGAAELLLQSDVTGDELADADSGAGGGSRSARADGAAARALARPDAARVIVDRALTLVT